MPAETFIKTGADLKTDNQLFPVFFKFNAFRLLLIGAGNAGLEKLNAIIHNSPEAKITIVAETVHPDIKKVGEHHSGIKIYEKSYDPSDLLDIDIVFAAVNEEALAERIKWDANNKSILVNTADKPELCDFYLGSVVKKGDLKIAISTNGKSPTIAKRLKETLSEVLPDQLDQVLDNMQTLRNKMNGNFTARVNELNRITKILSVNGNTDYKDGEKKWKKIATWSLFAFFFMIVGHIILSFVPFQSLLESIKGLPAQIDSKFYWMILAGFLAQLVDGALGMGYGVTCTTILLSLGVNLAAISGSIHTAEMFSSGVSGYSHYKFGNVNKKLFKALLIPGVLGAILGAYLLSKFGDQYANYIRPFLALYTLFLGIRIIYTAFKKKQHAKKVKNVGWLGGAGGFLDSFGGGGWGPLVTSTLIAKGRTPRFVIGSVSISEFFVTLASAVTFFSMLGISHWQVIVGLIIGGLVAAPIAAKLAGRLPLKTMFIAVGALVIVWSLRILIKIFI